MLSCAGADRLQQGMRGAWGKSYGKVCRVSIGDPLISVRVKAQNVPVAQLAFKKASRKFPGRQKIFISRKWGFTQFTREKFQGEMAKGKVEVVGLYAREKVSKGPLDRLKIFQN